MNIKDFKVGQTVFILDNDARSKKKEPVMYIVTNVGRKYVTVRCGSWITQFGAEEWADGFLVEKTEFGSKKYLFPSQESVNNYLERQDLQVRLRMATEWQKVGRYSLKQLRAVVRILENPAGEEAAK